MGLVTIRTERKAREERKFLHNGMKPFFLFGAVQSVLSMMYWTVLYTFHAIPVNLGLSPFHVHAHELVYGFTLAIIAGFLLAALPEWTNVATVSGKRLAGLVVLWAIPRIMLVCGAPFLWLAAVCDLLFAGALFVAVAHPIISSRSWRQSGILTKVGLLAAGNLCFYLGAFQAFPNGIYLSLYGGLYIIVSLILTVGGRVLPGYMQNALERSTPKSTPRWLTVATMVLFVAFFILELARPDTATARYLAISLGVLTSIRLFCWYDHGMWGQPLLWGLYLAFVSITLGFFLFGTTPFTGASKTVALHA